MSDVERGVGVNGEPDDFEARYDRMVVGGGFVWVVRTVLAIVVTLVLVGAVASLIAL